MTCWLEKIVIDAAEFEVQPEVASAIRGQENRIRELEAQLAELRKGEPVAYLEPDRHFPAVVHANEAHVGQKSTWIPLYREAAPRVSEECEWRCAPIGTIIKRASSVQFIFDQLDTVADGDYRFFIEVAPDCKSEIQSGGAE